MSDATTAQIEELEAKVRELEKVLGVKDDDLLVTFKLSPTLNAIFGLMLSQKLVTADMIERRLAIASEAKVAVHRLRTSLKHWEIGIESKRNLGYWLTAQTKEKVRQLVAREITPEGTGGGSEPEGERQLEDALAH